MSPIEFARAMRLRGWRYRRHSKGRALFGKRFPNGFGVTKVVDVSGLVSLQMSATSLADYLTRDAALSARFDMRQVV